MTLTKRQTDQEGAITHLKHSTMKKEKQKQVYSAPLSELLEVKTEGVICESGTLQDYNVNSYFEE